MQMALQFGGADATLSLQTAQPAAMSLASGAVEVPMGKEIDPTVPAWAKQPNPPTPDEIGAVGDEEMIEISNQDILDMFKK